MLKRGLKAVLDGRRATHRYVRRRSIKTLSIRADSWLLKATGGVAVTEGVGATGGVVVTEGVGATGGHESLRWPQDGCRLEWTETEGKNIR